MPDNATAPSSWVYPDWDSWRQLLNLRPKPLPVMDKPSWWTGRWSAGRPIGQGSTSQGQQRRAEAVRGEFSWAQRCLLYGQAALSDPQAKDNAGRIADALGRARLSLDSTEKALSAEQAASELSGTGAYDPAKYPHAFVDRAGQSIAAAGRAMEAARFEAVAYWGRVLARMGGFFRSIKHGLPAEK